MRKSAFIVVGLLVAVFLTAQPGFARSLEEVMLSIKKGARELRDVQGVQKLQFVGEKRFATERLSGSISRGRKRRKSSR